MEKIRLQKLLAEAGQGSRREIEQWITAGRITVNGVPAKLGDKASVMDRVCLNGERIRFERRAPLARVLAYHKPDGEISTRKDPEGRQTVFERLPKLQSGRWIAIGRLDLTTSGLLLFTTYGTLANALMHPSREVEREYAVRVLGDVDASTLERLRSGVALEDGMAKFERIVDAGGSGANRWYHVVLKEGRHHEVKRMWETQGFGVSRLIRVRYGPIELGRKLKPGEWRDLDDAELRALFASAGMPPPTRKPTLSANKRPGKVTRRNARSDIRSEAGAKPQAARRGKPGFRRRPGASSGR